MSEKLYLLTPAGRMVQGDCFAGSDKDQNGRPRVDKSGQPKMQWYIGLAIAKTDPDFAVFWGQVQQKAAIDFPNGAAGMPTFAWKLIDGDAPEHAGKEGFPGHYILRLTTGYAPTVIDTAYQVLTDPNAVKRGYFLQVSVSVAGNGEPPNGKPGVYINPMQIMLIGYGVEISNAPPPEQVFANRATILPPGASATPLAPASAGVAVGLPGAAAVPLQVAPAAAIPGQPAPVPGYAPQPGAVVPGAGPPTYAVPPAAIPVALQPAVAAVPVAPVPQAAPPLPGAVVPAQPVVAAIPGQPVPVAPAAAVVPVAGFLAPQPAPIAGQINPATGLPF